MSLLAPPVSICIEGVLIMYKDIDKFTKAPIYIAKKATTKIRVDLS